jgi:hypothetical protein
MMKVDTDLIYVIMVTYLNECYSKTVASCVLK